MLRNLLDLLVNKKPKPRLVALARDWSSSAGKEGSARGPDFGFKGFRVQGFRGLGFRV